MLGCIAPCLIVHAMVTNRISIGTLDGPMASPSSNWEEQMRKLTLDQKAVIKSLIKVATSVAGAWVATAPLDGEVRLAVLAAVAAIVNALYSWFDASDTRYGRYE